VSIIYEPETPMPFLEMYTTGVSFHTGRVRARPEIPGILELVGAGRLRPHEVTSLIAPFDDAAEAVLEPQTKLVLTR
jgi:alcohol dehydrogenase